MTTPNPTDVDNIVTCATNEGELYPRWCKLARSAAPDGDWCNILRPYLRHLIRNHRYNGTYDAATVIAAAAAIRDYYLRHIKEMG